MIPDVVMAAAAVHAGYWCAIGFEWLRRTGSM